MTAKYLSKEEVDKLWKRLGSCDLCGHGCRIDRLAGERGVCDSGQKLKISSAFPHFGEEDVLVGKRGSGAIFLSGCSMGCVYCQNWHISQQGKGEEMGEEKLAEIMLQLQQKGCHNINLVTPTHFIPQLVTLLFIAKKRDLHVPIVYNTSGYDNPEMIKCLDGIIDIYTGYKIQF